MKNALVILALLLSPSLASASVSVHVKHQPGGGSLFWGNAVEVYTQGSWHYIGTLNTSEGGDVFSATDPVLDFDGNDMWVRFDFDSTLIAQYDGLQVATSGVLFYDEQSPFWDSTWGPSSFQEWVPPTSVGGGSSGGGGGETVDTEAIEASLKILEFHAYNCAVTLLFMFAAMCWRNWRLAVNEGHFW